MCAAEVVGRATYPDTRHQAKWEATEEKPAVIAISAASFVAIWAASALVDGINKLPFFGSFFELVGLVVTAWFAYRYLIFGPDRCVCICWSFTDHAFHPQGGAEEEHRRLLRQSGWKVSIMPRPVGWNMNSCKRPSAFARLCHTRPPAATRP